MRAKMLDTLRRAQSVRLGETKKRTCRKDWAMCRREPQPWHSKVKGDEACVMEYPLMYLRGGRRRFARGVRPCKARGQQTSRIGYCPRELQRRLSIARKLLTHHRMRYGARLRTAGGRPLH